MAVGSKIEWTDITWNPVTGCTKVSPGCKHCYAHRMANRLFAMGQPRYANNFNLTLQKDLIGQPLGWGKPRFIFVNSMSDLFHPDVPLDYIKDIFSIMKRAYWHVFQVLTKRSERLRELAPELDWPDNIWMGVSVETSEYFYRIYDLRTTKAAIKFVSAEPLLGPLSRLPLGEIDWVIVGGESGPRAREMKPEWVKKIRDRCVVYDTPFFFKQWGGKRKSSTGRTLDGVTWDEFPGHGFNKYNSRLVI